MGGMSERGGGVNLVSIDSIAATLDLQVTELANIRERLRSAAGAVRPLEAQAWTGRLRDLYDAEFAELRRQLALGSALVTRALNDTRLARASVQQRVG